VRVEITNSSNGKIIQTLKSKDRFDNEGHGLSFSDLEFIDLNSDGYLDLRILVEMGVSGNNWFATYIYLPGLRQFRYHEVSSRLSGIKLDSRTKQIITYWRMGWCNEFIEHFKIDRNGKLSLRRVEWTEMSLSYPDKVCFRITGIPHDKNVTDLGYNFYYEVNDDSDACLQKNVRVISKEIIYGSIDGDGQNTTGQ